MRKYWEVLRKRWIIVVAIPLITALTSGVISHFVIKPSYKASTTLIVGTKAVGAGQAAKQIQDNNVLLASQ